MMGDRSIIIPKSPQDSPSSLRAVANLAPELACFRGQSFQSFLLKATIHQPGAQKWRKLMDWDWNPYNPWILQWFMSLIYVIDSLKKSWRFLVESIFGWPAKKKAQPIKDPRIQGGRSAQFGSARSALTSRDSSTAVSSPSSSQRLSQCRVATMRQWVESHWKPLEFDRTPNRRMSTPDFAKPWFTN